MSLIAPRLDVIKPSPSMAVTGKALAMRAAGIDVISLSAGEPDFQTPKHIVEAAYSAMRKPLGSPALTDSRATIGAGPGRLRLVARATPSAPRSTVCVEAGQIDPGKDWDRAAP